MTNIEIAQLISERIGQSPIPHNDIRNISYEIYQELGGESELEDFEDIYELLLTILPMAREGGVGIIDDTSVRTDKTWSSNKINSELSKHYTKSETDTLLNGKQATLTAGQNITINGSTISANVDLSNYYNKGETDTLLNGKQNTLIAGQNIVITNDTISAVIDAGFHVEVVQTLPITGEVNTIYFVPKAGGANPNVYDEYMYINNAWEHIGSTEVDLSNYYNKTEVDTLLSGKQATLTAGANITINGTTISATDTTYSASDNIDITNNAIKAVGYRYNTTNGAFAEGDRDIDESGTVRHQSVATGVMAHAEGCDSTATGNHSHTEGNLTNSVGNNSHAEGYTTTSTGTNSHAEGRVTNSIGNNSHAEGNTTTTRGVDSHTEGYNTETGGNYTTNTKTDGIESGSGSYAHAEGNATIAQGIAAHSEGKLTFAKTNNSHVEGQLTTTIDNAGNAHAEGYKSTSRGYASHTEGYDTETGGNYGSATSNPKTAGDNTSVAAYSHAEGNACIAYGNSSHAEGKLTFAKANCSHAEGQGTLSLASNGHTEGFQTKCEGSSSHAEGYLCEAGGNYTTNTKTAGTQTVNGSYSHAEGNATIANGVAAHSEGVKTLAKGTASHAEGNTTIARGVQSHAEGYNTETNNSTEHAQGSLNVSHTGGSFGSNMNTEHSIGIGASNTRKNAVELMQNGDAYLLGVGNYDGIHIKGETGAPSGLQTLQEAIGGKQNTLTAGDNIDITNNTITALGYEYNSSSDSITNGAGCFADGENSHAEGYQCYTLNDATASHAEGVGTETNNINEHAQGRYNVSHTVDVTLTQHEGNTVVSVGIGEDGGRKNAFEIMQNGDIYVYGVGYYDGTATKYDDPNVMTLQDIIKAIADNTGIDLGVLF